MGFLILFVSCNQFDNGIIDKGINAEKTFAIEKYVEKQIELSTKLFKLIEKENINDLYLLDNVKDYDYKDLKNVLKDANIKEYNAISNLLKDIDNTNLNFIENNLDFKKYEKIYLENLIVTEIDNQLDNITESHYLKNMNMNPCQQARHTGILRCLRNFTIGVAASATSGFFTFGIGAAIGAIATLGMFTLCMSDVHSDYDICVNH